ncbi:type II toxin-antitoxin system HicA family toxin [Dyella sp. ASV21]|uniref:type II toxin-antitoxin system HicA family toxin n=1 Tax=Dyella sp. ASV21 TaxID=2795114 RepID=UPI0031B812A2
MCAESNKYVACNKSVAIMVPTERHGREAMKYSEFIRWLRAQGVIFERQRGSHQFVRYNGKTTVVPNHGSKEIPEPLRKKIIRDLGL